MSIKISVAISGWCLLSLERLLLGLAGGGDSFLPPNACFSYSSSVIFVKSNLSNFSSSVSVNQCVRLSLESSDNTTRTSLLVMWVEYIIFRTTHNCIKSRWT